MTDEQIIVDIEVKDKEVVQASKNIDGLSDSIEELGNSIKSAKKQNDDYKKEQKKLNDLYNDGKISTEKYEKEIDKLNTKIKSNNKFLAESTVELGNQKRERTANIKLVNSEISSRDRLRQKIALLTKEYNGLNTETEEGRQRSDALQKELKQLNTKLNEGSKAAGSFKDNIGNYPEVASGALISIDQLGDGLENVGGSSANAVGGIKSMGQAFKALLANPVVLTLAAIVAGLAALGTAFKKSETGSRLLSKANAAMKGSFAVLTRFVDDFGKAAEKSFKEGEDGTVGFWKALKENFVNRIQGIMDLMSAIGDGIKAMWSGTAEEIQKAGDKAKNALIQITTGLNENQFNGMINKMKEMAGVAALITQGFIDLESAQRANRSSVRFLQKDIAKLSGEFEKLSEVAGDDTRSMQEMRDAAIQASKKSVELAAQQKRLASARLGIINQEISVRRAAGEEIQDLLDEQAEAQVALTEATSQSSLAQQKILIEQRKIERDIFEQNLDILIDVGDKMKTEQEKVIKNESLTLQKRKQLLNASKRALTDNFKLIAEEYELYGVSIEEINDVINASDANQTNERLKALGLNEIANNRLREIILERRQAELDFNDLQQELSDEEIERKEKANKKIKKLDEDKTLSQIENAEELEKALIKLEKEKLVTMLLDETLIDIEREALTKQTEANISAIEQQFADEKKLRDKETWENVQATITGALDNIANITSQFAGEEMALFGRISSEMIKSFDDGKLGAEEALNGINNISKSVFQAISERRAQDLEESEAARQEELNGALGNAEEEARINKKYDKIQADAKLKQWKADKAAALLNIGIQTALAAVKTASQLGFPLAIPFVAAVVALGGIQAALVASKKPPKFGGGVNDIVSIGDSHSSGNDVDVWGYSGNDKQYFGKVEKGEAMPVIRKSAVNDYMVSQLNGKFSSNNNRTFQDGTPDITNTQAQGNALTVEGLAEAFSEITVEAKIEDITKMMKKKMEIVNNSKF